MRLQEKIAIVTGAGSGIGQATARLFAQEGARLVLNDINRERLDRVVAEVGKEQSRGVVGDVVQEDTARRLAQEAVTAYGRIDILVNNAGIHMTKDITEMTEAEWNHLMNTNLKSMFLCCKHVIPHMVQHKKGAIVNLASVSSFIGQELEGVSTFAYNITKAGALQLTKSLATRYAADGIRVNCVCPGAIETNIITRATPEETAALWRAFVPVHPMGRNGQPQEVAQAIVFLASDEASFVTGCPLLVDGGWLAR
jgi:meso-butanediol dehydrogenase/(S,S)-butanediol dehydrogenase/diacetyl reductase